MSLSSTMKTGRGEMECCPLGKSEGVRGRGIPKKHVKFLAHFACTAIPQRQVNIPAVLYHCLTMPQSSFHFRMVQNAFQATRALGFFSITGKHLKTRGSIIRRQDFIKASWPVHFNRQALFQIYMVNCTV